MKPLAMRVAAILSGKAVAIGGIGRLDYVGRFTPFGTAEIEVDIVQDGEGWKAVANNIRIPYTHDSPRIITHVGIFIFDRWYWDALGNPPGHALTEGDVAEFSAEYLIREQDEYQAADNPPKEN